MRRVPLALAVAGLLALSACGSSGKSGTPGTAGVKPPSIPALQALGAGEGQVNIVAWAGYAEDGTDDKSVDWVHPFETATGSSRPS